MTPTYPAQLLIGKHLPFWFARPASSGHGSRHTFDNDLAHRFRAYIIRAQDGNGYGRVDPWHTSTYGPPQESDRDGWSRVTMSLIAGV
jgi:hypothetical protein